MSPVQAALQTITDDARGSHHGFYSNADWEAIVARWESGVSCGVIYDALKTTGNMPYRSERSFYRAFENQREKRNARKH